MLDILCSLLTSFSSTTAKNEKDLYDPFVKLSNTALQCLKLLEIEGMRKTIQDLSFHVNDPNCLLQSHNGKKSKCKPDIVIFQNTHKPFANLHWGGILSVIEFKHRGPMTSPLLNFSFDKRKPLSQHYLVKDCMSEL